MLTGAALHKRTNEEVVSVMEEVDGLVGLASSLKLSAFRN